MVPVSKSLNPLQSPKPIHFYEENGFNNAKRYTDDQVRQTTFQNRSQTLDAKHKVWMMAEEC
jgi:hypothetical protein